MSCVRSRSEDARGPDWDSNRDFSCFGGGFTFDCSEGPAAAPSFERSSTDSFGFLRAPLANQAAISGSVHFFRHFVLALETASVPVLQTGQGAVNAVRSLFHLGFSTLAACSSKSNALPLTPAPDGEKPRGGYSRSTPAARLKRCRR